VLGVDSGGSGLRFALSGTAGDAAVHEEVAREPVRTGPAGIDADHLLGQLIPAVRALADRVGAGRVSAACVGAAGMATLGGQLRERLPAALREAFGVRRLALAADAVTAYAGALGVRPGVVVAAGTGMIALGTALTESDWRRADGWGHLLGDCGGGAWIGRAGLEAAMRAYDGRAGGSTALLARLEERFGPAVGLPGLLYPRGDRPAVLASFAPEVAAVSGVDPVAAGILREAAGQLLTTAAAVRPDPSGGDVAFTGGLLKLGEPLLGPLRERAGELLPGARLVDGAGDPLHGALRIATALATGGPMLPPDPALLTLH
jgi:N-acetylglucosamine kinase-like BadF-type ATPase